MKCPVCQKSLTNNAALNDHIKAKHPNVVLSEQPAIPSGEAPDKHIITVELPRMPPGFHKINCPLCGSPADLNVKSSDAIPQIQKPLEQKDKFLVSLQMVSILRLVSFDGLRHSIKAVFDGSSPKELKRLVSVLLAAGYLRPKNDYFELVPGRAALLQFDDTDLNSLTARVLYYYQRHQREVFRSISA